MRQSPPPARRDDAVDELHGVRVPDPYRWLEDVSSAEVKQWMDAEDDHARDVLARLPGRGPLAERFKELFYFDAISPPLRRGLRLFYTRKHADKEKNIVYWKQADDADERVLFDPNEMSPDGTISLGIWVPSHDGALVAYALRENNADAATLYVREVASGRDLDTDVIAGAKYAEPSWLPDGSGFFYTRLPTDPDIDIADLPGHAEVCFHRIGEAAGGDRVVYPATGDPQTFVAGEASRDGRCLVVHIAHGWRSSDIYVADLPADQPVLRPLVVGVDAVFNVTAWDGRLLIHTNDGAPRYRVYSADPADAGRDKWREIVAETGATLERAQIIGGHLVLSYLRDACSELEVRTLEGEPVRTLPLPGLGTVSSVVGTEDEGEAYVSYSSFTEPTRIFRVEIPDGEASVWARVELPIDSSQLRTDQVRFASKDGTEITMFILRRHDVSPDAARPTILYGYGGFNHGLTPAFSPSVIPWLERGGVYAVANLRGGNEYGEEWHKAGMLLDKQNVFDDFIAAAEYLIASGWTTREQLAIRGGSNGGLLVGAAMTQRPDLFRTVVCAVPLLDMVRYHLFGSGKTWIPEYGSVDDPDQFAAIHAYSPYHRLVGGTSYPALLMLSADNDDRVDPMHARKFVAAVRHATSGDAPVLLRIERNAGHGGADMVAQQVDQSVDAYAFLIDQLRLP